MCKIYLFYLNSHFYGFGRILNVQNLIDDNSNFNNYKKLSINSRKNGYSSLKHVSWFYDYKTLQQFPQKYFAPYQGIHYQSKTTL